MALEKATERSRKNYFHSSSLCLFFYHSEMLVAKVFSLLSLFNPEWPIHDAEVLRDALVIITISIIFIAKVMKMSHGHPHPGYDAATTTTTSTRPFLFANTFWCPFCRCYIASSSSKEDGRCDGTATNFHFEVSSTTFASVCATSPTL